MFTQSVFREVFGGSAHILPRIQDKIVRPLWYAR